MQGGGDPKLVSEDLWQIAADIHNLGIRRITGDIIIDNSLFQIQARDESRESGRKSSDNAWDAPVTAFGVNFNTLAISVAPAEESFPCSGARNHHIVLVLVVFPPRLCLQPRKTTTRLCHPTPSLFLWR